MHAIIILGAGGHGRVVRETIDAMAAAGKAVAFAGFIDPNADSGTPDVIGTDDAAIGQLAEQGRASAFVIGLGMVRGGSETRQRMFDAAIDAGLAPAQVVHPLAIVSPTATVEDGAVVFAGAVINSGARIGANAIVNTGAIIDHDSRIAAHAHIGPGVAMSGGVEVGARALVGVGAVCRENTCVGANATLGAGGVLLGRIPAGEIWAGAPAHRIQSRAS